MSTVDDDSIVSTVDNGSIESTVDDASVGSTVDGGSTASTVDGELGLRRALVAQARRGWRWLTSMRTALILLFLLALAAIPGSLLPQRDLNQAKVTQYFRDHRVLAPWLDRVSAFDVFSSPWFAAIYLLLFVSLVGCLVPRARAHAAALLRVPPDAPARLDRLPVYAGALSTSDDPVTVAAALRAVLRRRRFRVAVRDAPGGGRTVSAEKGFLKETGNLLFHFSLMLLLAGVAAGSWYGYHAERILVQGPDQGFCNTLAQYDDFGLGARVNPADLAPFCLELTDFRASYRDTGQASGFAADVRYTVGDEPAGPGNGTPTSAGTAATISPNEPLRLTRARIYLLGHGYAPVLRYTDRYGHAQTTIAPFLPLDALGTSSGLLSFPDANTPPAGTAAPGGPDAKAQVAFSGVYVPTSDGQGASSTFPAERNPVLVLTAYRGDLGLSSGIPHSVYQLDASELASGRLRQVSGQLRLRPGQSATLDDVMTVQFLGTRAYATVAVRYDPGETVVLVGAIMLLAGLVTMLFGRRRRVWFRIGPVPGGGATAAAAALARGEYAGFAEEFDALVGAARAALAPAGATDQPHNNVVHGAGDAALRAGDVAHRAGVVAHRAEDGKDT